MYFFINRSPAILNRISGFLKDYRKKGSWQCKQTYLFTYCTCKSSRHKYCYWYSYCIL